MLVDCIYFVCIGNRYRHYGEKAFRVYVSMIFLNVWRTNDMELIFYLFFCSTTHTFSFIYFSYYFFFLSWLKYRQSLNSLKLQSKFFSFSVCGIDAFFYCSSFYFIWRCSVESSTYIVNKVVYVGRQTKS